MSTDDAAPNPVDQARRRVLVASAAAAACLAAPRIARADPDPWARVFAKMPPAMAAIARDPAHEVQLVWRRLSPRRGGGVDVAPYAWGRAPQRWFSPASTMKLPMALLMAEHLSAHGLDADAVIALHAPPATGEWPAGEPLAETFRRGLARTFAVSDNVPYNRWYEALGTDRIHRRLQALGHPDVRLVSRYGSTDRDANRRTGGARLLDAAGVAVATLPAAEGEARTFPFGRAHAGRGWRNDDGTVVPGPRDFSASNFMPLASGLALLQAFVLPGTVPASRRWAIDGPLRDALLDALALRPRDSLDPRYDEATYPDGYARWFLVGDGRARYPDGVRVLGKTGMAYGYCSELALVEDGDAGARFLLGAVIHANADGILNDDMYDYDTVALPFLAALGRAVLAVEREDHGA